MLPFFPHKSCKKKTKHAGQQKKGQGEGGGVGGKAEK